jgi:hypothetical protein
LRVKHVLGVPLLAALASAFAGEAGCGSRSEPLGIQFGAPLEAGAPAAACLGDLDCGESNACTPVHCVGGACVAGPVVNCDDGDPCTTDSCAPDTGACSNVPVTPDEDGDGFRAPLPGFLPGAPGSCGNDCNDASASAHPGAVEVCDGVDNDCNGVVDDGLTYTPVGGQPLLLSSGARQASTGGVAFGTGAFGVTFAAQHDAWQNTFTGVSPPGALTIPEAPITHESTDAFSGPVVFNGSVFGNAWEDRRDNDYEIYFNRLDPKGQKLAKDLRVTNAPNFSLSPDIVWDGTDFVLVWDDLRDGDDSAVVFAQTIDGNGKLVGGNVPLTSPSVDADSPHVAKGSFNLGVTFNQVQNGVRALGFLTSDFGLTTVSITTVLTTGNAASSAVAWANDRFVVVWDTDDTVPGHTIRGATVNAAGSIIAPERDVTAPAPFARSEALLSLGDRLLLVWAEENDGVYALYSKTIGTDLSELSPKAQVTFGPADSINPALAFGPNGVGVVFDDRRSGSFQVYYTRLDCGGGGGF